MRGRIIKGGPLRFSEQPAIPQSSLNDTRGLMSKQAGLWWALVGVLLIVGLFMFVGSRRAHSMANDLDALRKDGAPITFPELQAMQPQTGENAYPLIHKAGELLQADPMFRTFGDFITTDWANPSRRAKGYKLMAKLQPIIDLSRRAGEMPRSVAPPPRSGDINSIADYSPYDNLALLMVGLAIYESQANDISAALKDLTATKGFSRQLATTQDFGNFDLTNIVYLIGLNEWSRIMNEHANDRKTLQLGNAWLKDLPPAASLRDCFASEIPMYRAGYERAIDDPAKFAKEMARARVTIPAKYANKISLRLAEGQDVHAMRIAYESLPRDESDWISVQKVFQAASASRKDPAKVVMDDPFALFSGVAHYGAVRVAADRIARQSIAVLLYRNDHGCLPDALPLSGQDAIDPFSGKPMIYKKLGKGFIIYSIGPDLKDNGGPHGKYGKDAGAYAESKDPGMRFD